MESHTRVQRVPQLMRIYCFLGKYEYFQTQKLDWQLKGGGGGEPQRHLLPLSEISSTLPRNTTSKAYTETMRV